jgi:hypothetical protein
VPPRLLPVSSPPGQFRRIRRRSRWAVPAFTVLLGLAAGWARAGPPFLTDDPEPVGPGHWEFYAASQWAWSSRAAAGTSPHFELNYGAAPGLQLHVIVPVATAWEEGSPARTGPGDIELGAKLRFVEEGRRRPEVGIFPLVTLPSGSAERGLGAGHAAGFLPVWLQKSFGPWTTYGGGGFRVGPGEGALVLGGLLQRKVSKRVTLGAEVYRTHPLGDGPDQTQLNAGGIIDFTERHHLLLSVGPSTGGDSRLQAYVAYQLTL